jgi:hypothetical protein
MAPPALPPAPPVPEPESRPLAPRPRARSAAAWLAEARRDLVGGDARNADRNIARALASRPTSREAAEARTLSAESAQVAGDTGLAVARYLVVADRYPGLPAGELALFAAARLEAGRGRQASARRLYERYLERHPAGRMRAEATRRARELGGSGTR